MRRLNRTFAVGLAAITTASAAPGQIAFSDVSTIAGPMTWARGLIDGTGSAARFDQPSGLAINSAGDIFVAEPGNNNAIRRITPAGVVTTFAGGSKFGAYLDGIGTAARFKGPEAIAIDAMGNLIVADTGNHVIRKITPAAEVTTIAGIPGNFGAGGYADGPAATARFHSPSGVVVNPAGVIYVADQINHVIRQISPTGDVTTLAGSPGQSGEVDDTGSAARFTFPWRLAIDSAGDLYVVEAESIYTVRKVTAAGVVTTVAGLAGVWGSADGVGSAARFSTAEHLTVGPDGFVYVSDSGNNTIRAISPAGVVTTVIGSPLRPWGAVDGPIADARLFAPSGLAFDAAGNLYIAEADFSHIRKATRAVSVGAPIITAQPADQLVLPMETIRFDIIATSTPVGPLNYQWERSPAGSVTWSPLSEDATYTGVTTDHVFVHDTTLAMNGDRFRCVVSNGVSPDATSRIATLGVADPNQTITFPQPADRTYGDAPFALGATASSGLPVSYAIVSGPGTIAGDTLTITGGGTITVRASQPGNNTTITPAPDVDRTILVAKKNLTATAADLTRARGYANPVFAIGYAGFVGTDTVASLDTPPVASTPADVASLEGTYAITLSGGSDDSYAVTLVDGSLTITRGFTFRTWLDPNNLPSFANNRPQGAVLGQPAIHPSGDLLVPEYAGDVIRRVSRTGDVSLFAGHLLEDTDLDGPLASATFADAYAMAVGSDGTIYVGEPHRSVVRKISPDGVVSTLAGLSGVSGAIDGPAGVARLGYPIALAVDGDGNVIVADETNDAIRRIAPDGSVDTIGGKAGEPGTNDGPASVARFDNPIGVCVNAIGDIFVIELLGTRIRRIAPDGVVTTVAGALGQSGVVDGRGSDARFFNTSGLAIDAADNLYVCEHLDPGGLIRIVTPAGDVVTIAGSVDQVQAVDGIGVDAGFGYPAGIVVAPDGIVYVRETFSDLVRAGAAVGAAPVVTSQPQSRIVVAPPAVTFSASASGSPPPGFRWQRSTGADATWSDLVNDTTFVDVASPTLTVLSPDVSMDGHRFRAVVNNIVDPETVSNAAVLHVVVGGATFSGTVAPIAGVSSLSVHAQDSSANGDWALFHRPDGTATFIAYLAATQSAIVLDLVVAPDGSFSASGTTTVAQNGAITGGVAFTLTGQINGAVLSAQLTGVDLTVTGALDAAPGPAAQFAGLYTAAQLNASSGATYAIVGASGDAVIVALSAAGVSGGVGTVDVSGRFTTVLASGDLFAATISATTLGFAAQVSPAAGGSPQSFAGLSSFEPPLNRLVNISTRGFVGTGAQALIAGFVIDGPADKQVLVRAIGPGLTDFGIAGPVSDPRLDLVRQEEGVVTFSASNDDWGTAVGAPAIAAATGQVGAFALTDGGKDAALLSTLPPGVYTALAGVSGGGTGIGLVEVYETLATAAADLRLVNISTRGQVNTGEQILIVGFVVTGNTPKRLLIRGIGPGLAPYLLPADQPLVLVDPQLTLFDGSDAIVATNDDWESTGDGALIDSTAAAVGAFPIASGSKDAVLLLNLAPGSYTAHLRGVSDTTGLAIIEVYETR